MKVEDGKEERYGEVRLRKLCIYGNSSFKWGLASVVDNRSIGCTYLTSIPVSNTQGIFEQTEIFLNLFIENKDDD